MDKKQYYVTLFMIVFVLLFAILFSWWQSDNSQLSISCKFNQIELVNLTPDKCWNEEFSSKYCPIPKDIDCSVDIKGLADFIVAIAKQ